jgi:hypothetical protein
MGFQGFEVDGVVIIQPKKKPRGGTLTDEEKEGNRRINSGSPGIAVVEAIFREGLYATD